MRTFEIDIEDLIGPLNEIEAKYAPERLFGVGDRELLSSGLRVAVVGTRQPSELGIRRTQRLCRFLVEHEVTVVSGLAMGVDTIAHTTTMEAQGRTIAVLGTPLDQVTPSSNKALQKSIGNDHLLVSQFPVGQTVSKGNFPQRNRTMALLSNASVIVEAGDGSGTLHQGFEAVRLGRPLFILKSLVDDPNLSWPAELLRYGAIVLNEPAGLLEYLPVGFSGARADYAF